MFHVKHRCGGVSFSLGIMQVYLVAERKDVDARQEQLLKDYLEAILRKNEALNLTTIRSYDEGLLLHVEDSLSALKEIAAAPEGRLVDMGTGGGFPGVPLAVVSGRDVLLVDSTKKKIDAVLAITRELGIEQVGGFAGRIEELALEEPEAFAVATARALAPLAALLELSSPLLQAGGQLVAYKSAHVEEELERATGLEGKLGMKLISSRELTLSDKETPRCIYVFEKVAQPRVQLPRRPGMAQKRPYA